MSWFKFYHFTNLFRQKAPKNTGIIERYLPYDTPGHPGSDNFPLTWAQDIADSTSATSCLNTLKDFIEGYGFSEPALEKVIMNAKKETFWQFHQQTVDSWGPFHGVYWLAKYNALGKVVSWEVLPFQNCRLGVPDDNGYISKIYYNPFFGTSEYKGKADKNTVIYDTYNPSAAVTQYQEQGDKFKGQVFFFGTTTPLSPYYPIHTAYAGKGWFKIESGVEDYHEDNITNGFLQPFMLVMKGNPNEPSSNPDFANHNGEGRPATVAQEFDSVVSANFMGAKRVGNMFVQWVNIGDEAPEAVALPANNNGDLFNTLDNQATKKITIAWNVPAILANINEGVSLGGDGNAVRVAVKLMQQRVKKQQRVLTDNYQAILGDFLGYAGDITIAPYNPYPEMEEVNAQVWDTLTPEEKRNWINENSEIKLLTTPAQGPAAPSEQTAAIKTAKYTNAIPIEFSNKIKSNVKKAIEYQDKMSLQCSGKGGREVSQMIIDGKPMGFRQLKRIHSYLKKNAVHDNKPFNEGCDAISYQAWGGKDMFDYLESKIKDLEEWLN